MRRESEPPLADLVRRARDPRTSIHEQHSAFATLVERFEDAAFATALRASRDIESARDACQEAFLVAWRRLPDLREPAAFGGWLKRLVRSQCARARRRRSASVEVRSGGAEGHAVPDDAGDAAELVGRREEEEWIRRAVHGLPAAERRAVVLFYFLGESLRLVGRSLGVSEATAGKRLYTARLRLRRCLPRGVAAAFLGGGPTPGFARRVRAGVLDEFVGEYRFDKRPNHPIRVRREGAVLASYARGQRNVLASRGTDVLRPTEYDGEARFRRDRRGQVSHFIYYEFGRRLGIARKVK
jgi:RNA polymerase sigma-70 factor (ECF subfamily)